MNLYRTFALANDPTAVLPACYQMWLHAKREARIAYSLAIHRSRTS